MNTKNEIQNLNTEKIIKQLKKYNILDKFSSEKELRKWIFHLNDLEINNILSLNIEPGSIKFDSELLIDKNLLNTTDYLKRVKALVSIENAEGWYHLFDRMLRPEFLNSEKFYQDIESLKRAESAQIPLWIIGEPTFINSKYHDEDFELLVTAKDTCEEEFDYVVWDAIARVAECEDSIRSEYHRKDLETIVKYGSKALQISGSYPERGINYLAINPVSLKDKYHLENMEILATNIEIGNFLYAVMTNKDIINKSNYRRIINEMIENKDNINYVFLVCYYAIGEKAKDAQNILLHSCYRDITRSYDIEELLKKVDEKINIIDSNFKKKIIYEIESKEYEYVEENLNDKVKSLVKKSFKKNKVYNNIIIFRK